MDQLQQAKIILWDGYCEVHMRFLPDHVLQWRLREPEIQVMIHPECNHNVVRMADQYGSTEAIIAAVANSPAGSKWAIGTESRLVHRLQTLHPEQKIITLADVPPFCGSMSRITLPKLASLLEALARGEVPNEVTVDAETARWARIALERMLEL